MKTEVLVVGAGITGAIAAHRLASEGRDVLVVDGRDAGQGSSSASTALLQYEIDTGLAELVRLYGEDTGRSAYRACCQAVKDFEALDGRLHGATKFHRRPSFYFAASDDDLPELRAEFAARERAGLPVEFWSREQIERQFEFSAPGGIMSSLAGDLDPYAATYALLCTEVLKGRIFDRTKVLAIDWGEHSVRAMLDTGSEITCEKIVLACGYESLSFLPRLPVKLHSTFAMVTEPLTRFPKWAERSLIWETARPYMYLRSTDDDRILAGGEDCSFDNETKRDALIPAKTKKIVARVQELFPSIPLAVDYSWAGTFAETKDGLPYIGKHPDRPGGFFLLCYGGNGITYSTIGSDMLAAEMRGETHPLVETFGFGRSAQKASQ